MGIHRLLLIEYRVYAAVHLLNRHCFAFDSEYTCFTTIVKHFLAQVLCGVTRLPIYLSTSADVRKEVHSSVYTILFWAQRCRCPKQPHANRSEFSLTNSDDTTTVANRHAVCAAFTSVCILHAQVHVNGHRLSVAAPISTLSSSKVCP